MAMNINFVANEIVNAVSCGRSIGIYRDDIQAYGKDAIMAAVRGVCGNDNIIYGKVSRAVSDIVDPHHRERWCW